MFQEDVDMRLLSHDASQSRVLLSTHNTPCFLGSELIHFSMAALAAPAGPMLPQKAAPAVTAYVSIQCNEPRKWAVYKRPFEARVEVSSRSMERSHSQSFMRSDGSNKAPAMMLHMFQCLETFEHAGDSARAVCAHLENTAFKIELVRATWQHDASSCQTQWRITAETTEPDTFWGLHTIRLVVSRLINDDGRATVVRVCTPARAQLFDLCTALRIASNEAAALAAAQALVAAFFYCTRVQQAYPDWFTHAEAASMALRKAAPVLADVPAMWRHTMFESAWLGIAAAAAMDARRVPLCKRLLPVDAQNVMRTMDALATQVAHYEAALGHVPLISSCASASSGQWLDQIRSVGATLCTAITGLSS